ncbi:MAG TPA: alpha-amylase family glycosyl hydrolase, partial [Lachnospiraceae bacterium]|nr:alpha-amylase family glycosyl hydrolase [Lachnospiraceae bacterium]
MPGVSVHDNEWQFYCVSDCRHSLVLCLYENTGQLYAQIDMLPFKIAGNVYSVRITGLEEKDLEYAYEADGRPCCDPYKKKSAGHSKWGEFDIDGENIRSGFYRDEFDWGDDVPLKLPYNQIIAYSMHVRGFPKHSSSGVKAKGTYLGIIEKIQYLKELGINQIELLPIYEFYELDVEKELLPEGHPKYLKDRKEPPEAKINYWGFKYGSYYVPKASYAYGEDSTAEFKTLVKELHKNGIEIILQFYFPNEINRTVILDCLKFWTINYHVDGFHIMGEHLPIDFIASDPLLTDTKLYYAYYDKEHIFLGKYEHNHFLAEVNQEYMN